MKLQIFSAKYSLGFAGTQTTAGQANEPRKIMLTIRKAAVIGAGNMGAQIAAHLANVGIPSILMDIVPTELLPEEQKRGLTLLVEAVLERMDLKTALHAKIAAHARPDALVTTNTSGLSIAGMTKGLPQAYRRRFFGTHFFNPPRYMRLLELIPTSDTDPALCSRCSGSWSRRA